MTRSFLNYWAPVLLWMALIFSASGDKSSGQRSSRIIGPFVRWLVPSISDQALEKVVYSVRKMAHVSEYAILALLLWRALHKPATRQAAAGDNVRSLSTPGPLSMESRLQPADHPSWRWPLAFWAFALSALYAVTDEFHQSLVPSRQGQVSDVLLDSFGAALGLLGLWFFGRWRKHW